LWGATATHSILIPLLHFVLDICRGTCDPKEVERLGELLKMSNGNVECQALGRLEDLSLFLKQQGPPLEAALSLLFISE
jgi:hypothetical protein